MIQITLLDFDNLFHLRGNILINLIWLWFEQIGENLCQFHSRGLKNIHSNRYNSERYVNGVERIDEVTYVSKCIGFLV